ncbi:MAG: hypothetical protein H6634_00930 [Anaerolineales bacterium]|nr:hypothetical protein [Anaerolineales bacterium]
MKNPSRSYNFLWLAIALFPLLIIAVLLPVQPHDYWWYLRLGRDVVENGAVPIVDTYSSIQAGQPITYQSWMSASLFWLVYKAGKISFTVFLVTILIGATYAVLWMTLRESGVGAQTATLLTLIAGLSGSSNWTTRPQLFAYPLFVAVLWLLLKWNKNDHKPLWLLIPISWAWANLHGSFILFFVLIGIAFIFGSGDRKKLFWFALASFAITFLNPRGYVLWQSVIGTFTAPGIRNLSPEWLPPLNEGWQMNIFFAWLILLVPLAAYARKRLSLFEGILFLAFSWLALTGVRYVIWDLFIIAILTASLMPEGITKRIDQTPEVKLPALNYLLGLIFMLLPLMLLPGLRDSWWKDSPPAVSPATPVAAAEWLNQHPQLPGPMWNDVVFGSYLIHAVPTRPVWFDTRIQVIYTAEQAESYLFVQSAHEGWEAELDKLGINLLFLAQTQPALVSAVQSSDQWCEQYQDDAALIFTRCEVK